MTCHVARRTGEFERRLRRERRETHDALVTIDAEFMSCARERAGDPLDDAATETACHLIATLDEHDRRALSEIDAAEGRLAADTFGICETCARPIPVERLRVLPAARLCVSCEAGAERMRRGYFAGGSAR
jgi:RNA polymerase-binding transcription factor